MNDLRTSEDRPKNPEGVFWTIGLCALVISYMLAKNSNEMFSNWYWDSLGFVYGVLIYFTGLAGLFFAIRYVRGKIEATHLILIASLPALIGLTCMVHGYVSIHQSIAYYGATLAPSEMSQSHVTTLTSFLIGLSFSIVPLAIVSITTFYRQGLVHREAA